MFFSEESIEDVFSRVTFLLKMDFDFSLNCFESGSGFDWLESRRLEVRAPSLHAPQVAIRPCVGDDVACVGDKLFGVGLRC